MATPTFVLVPGLGSDAAVWRRTIAALNGDVECVVGNTLTDASLVRMAETILAQAPERFALAGVSMGGMIAMEIMRVAPHRVTHLALVDTSARPDAARQWLWRIFSGAIVRVAPDFRKLATRSVRSLVHPAAPDEVREELVEMSVRVGARVYVRQNRALAARADHRPVLRTITVPTAVIVGSDDQLTPVSRSQEIHTGIAGSELHILPGCGHLPPIEQPQAMAVLLLALVSGTDVGPRHAKVSN